MADPAFTQAAVIAGIRACTPLQAAVIPFALVCGIAAQAQGLSLAESVLMSGLCYAGSAQLLALSHWTVPAPIVGAAIAAFVVNLRMALMGPVIGPWLDRVSGWRLWGSLFLMADQNWALSVREMQAGRWDAGFLFGSGVLMWIVWVFGTAAGHVLGATLHLPPGHPLFFAALAVFVALTASMWRGRADLLPWIVAAVVSITLSRLSASSWYIVAGALAGAATGAARKRFA